MQIEIKSRINEALSKLPYPARDEKHLCPSLCVNESETLTP